jgi:NADH dehydrogenase
MSQTRRIVILGGGFGGVYTARALENILSPGDADVFLVNRENYFVFQPLLPEVISGNIGITDTVAPIRALCPRTRLYVREIERVDLRKRTVVLAPGTFRPKVTELSYDYLVIASGTRTDLSGMPGMAEHALAFKNLGDALILRNRALQALEEAENEPDSQFRRALLTFVVGGGGFSGVEVVAELNDFLRRAARTYRAIRPEEIRCVLVHSGDRILPEITPDLAAYAHRILVNRGVEILLKDRVAAARTDAVVLKSGNMIPARTIISTVPSGPVPLIQSLDCNKDKGRLLVGPTLELDGHEGSVWALGDCASIRMASGETAPPTAQHATREAETVAAGIAAAIRGEPKPVFDFGGLGKLGSLGHHSAVAEVLGVKISGLPAWFLWRTIYLLKMPGFAHKFNVAWDWTAALFCSSELVQLRTAPTDNVTTEHYEPGETVFEQGDYGDKFYLVRSGEVEVIRDGSRIAVLGPGEFFGEMALVSNAPRGASVRAVKPCDLTAVSRGSFQNLFESLPGFGEQILERIERRSR